MKIFVTGATGFIGKHLLHRLAGTTHQVTCLVRNPKKTALIWEAGARPVMGTITDREVMLKGMRGCDWVFDLAGLYAMWRRDREVFARTNIDGTRVVMECALETGISKVVYISTIAVYGKPSASPFNEESQPGPVMLSEYARTKAEGDRIAWEMHRTHGLPLVALYPGIVLGAGDDKASGQYIRDIIRRRVPSTIFHHSTETYVHVRDVVEAILRAADLPGTVGRKFFLGKEQLTGIDYARLIGEIAKVPLPPIPFPDEVVLAAGYLLTGLADLTGIPPLWGLSIDAGRTLKAGFSYDGSKAERELGVNYTPIRTALEEAIASYRQRQA
jgi:dihydroflavonol-4-reductase